MPCPPKKDFSLEKIPISWGYVILAMDPEISHQPMEFLYAKMTNR